MGINLEQEYRQSEVAKSLIEHEKKLSECCGHDVKFFYDWGFLESSVYKSKGVQMKNVYLNGPKRCVEDGLYDEKDGY